MLIWIQNNAEVLRHPSRKRHLRRWQNFLLKSLLYNLGNICFREFLSVPWGYFLSKCYTETFSELEINLVKIYDQFVTTVTPRVCTYKHTHYSWENIIFQYKTCYRLLSIHETRCQPLLPINTPGSFFVLCFHSLLVPKCPGFCWGGGLLKITSWWRYGENNYLIPEDPVHGYLNICSEPRKYDIIKMCTYTSSYN